MARRWGGDIIQVSQSRFQALTEEGQFGFRQVLFHEVGDGMGIDWMERRVYFYGEPDWVGVIHEMAHAFSTLESPAHSSDEQFLGWEFALCKLVRGDIETWKKESAGRPVPGTKSFGELSPKRQDALLARQIRKGQKEGIIDAKGRPLPVRRVVDLKKVRDLMLKELTYQHSRFVDPPIIRSGDDFERWAYNRGTVEGYQNAVEYVLQLISPMSV